MSISQHLKFDADGASAVDQEHGIRIEYPRVQPGQSEGEAEFQYPIIINGRNTGIGLFAEFSRLGSDKNRYVIKFDQVNLIDRALAYRDELGIKSDELEFLREFSRGLVLGYESGRGIYKSTEFLVVAKKSDLKQRVGGQLEELHNFGDDYVVLSEICVMPRTDKRVGA